MLGFLLIVGLTGAVLSFRWEIDTFLNPGLFRVAPAGTLLPQAEIIRHVESRFPDALVGSLTYQKSPEDSLRLFLKSKMEAHVAHQHVPGMKSKVLFNQIFVNPYTGAILGQRNTSNFVLSRENFVPFILRLHYSLFIEKWGPWLLGGCAVVWFITSFLGLVLSWPSFWTALKSWMPLINVRRRQGGYKLNYDLHRATGFIALPILIVVAFTSIVLNLPDLVKPIVRQFSPITSAKSVPDAGHVDIDQAVIPPEQAAAAALQVLPEARVQSISRDFIKGLYSVRLRLPTDISSSGNNMVYVRMIDGRTVLARTEASRTGADTFLAWQRPLKSGTAFGLTGQIVIALSALALVAMCITGLNIWLRKHSAENRHAKRLEAKAGLSCMVTEKRSAA